jgi:hypothetical protein
MISWKVPAALVIAAVVAATLLLFLTGTSERHGKSPGSPESPQAKAPSTSLAPSAAEGDGMRSRESSFGIAMREVVSQPESLEMVEPVQQPWEASINTILESTDGNDRVVGKLASLIPSLPLEGQMEGAQHMVNLLDDAQYKMATDLLLNPATPQSVKEIIYSDLLNRPNAVKLTGLVAILGMTGNPLRAEALNTLQVFTGEDLGDNSQLWAAAVQRFLQAEAAHVEP